VVEEYSRDGILADAIPRIAPGPRLHSEGRARLARAMRWILISNLRSLVKRLQRMTKTLWPYLF